MNIPINFHDVCTIYPLSVRDAISCFEQDEGQIMFIPFLLSKDIVDENFQQYSMLEIVLNDQKMYNKFIASLRMLCKTENIKMNPTTLDIFIEDNIKPLNKDNFEEFSEIVSTIVCMKKLQKNENTIPKFETEEGYQRWKKLQEQREKNKPKDEGFQIYDLLNCVQFGGNYYIPDTEIMNWTYWKLTNVNKTIILLKKYDFNCDAYLQCGNKKLIEKHWSELIKL